MTIASPAKISHSPERFARVFLRILDKEKSLVSFRWNRAQRHFHQHRTGRDLILKARQLGFSTYIQGEMFRRSVTGTRTTATMAHDDETTQKMRRIHDRFWEHCKFGSLQPLRKYSSATLITYPEFDSECMIATAGSKNAGRGGTYTDFHGSEVAFWKEADSIISGAMQGGNPDVVLESTPNGTQGWFYERCMEALEGNSIWQLHFYPWWWDDAYRISLEEGEEFILSEEESELVRRHSLAFDQIKWRRLKQLELGRLFIQEYPEDIVTCFLTSGNNYFGDLAGIFAAPMSAKYIDGHKYKAGLDWGQENDFLSMTVIDETIKQQVDLLHINRLSWTELRNRVKQKYDYWHLPYLIAEKNSIGSVNIEELHKLKMNINPFDTTNESKAQIMSTLYIGIHTSGLKLQPYESEQHEFRVFVSTQLPSGVWRLAAEGTNHDDTVISTALAWWAIANGKLDVF